jgi:surface antigen
MRRTAIVAGLFSCGFIFLGSASATVHAETIEPPVFERSTSSSDELAVLQLMDQRAEAAAQPPAPAPVQPVVHTVQNGESLASIASQHKTTWQRLFAKNTAIVDPDIISAGSQLTVPTADEQLAERPVPLKAAPGAPVPAEAPKTAATRPSAPRSVSRRGSSAGNTYTYGYCTWYVKNRRPDLPNNLGNADTWVSRAAAQGIPTGSVPRAGAVGQRGMHVVYVERVNADGTIFISEMNREGWNVTSTRTVPASYFSYIY